jgi:hypothetical protein
MFTTMANIESEDGQTISSFLESDSQNRPSVRREVSKNSIAVIGSTRIGKTTYLIMMTKFFSSLRDGCRVIQLDSKGDRMPEEKSLVQEADIILGTKDETNATPRMESYKFSIEIPQKYYITGRRRKFNVDIMDYAGETFDQLRKTPVSSDTINMLQPCLDSYKWLFLVNDWGESADNLTQIKVTQLINLVDKTHLSSLRIAVVISKCERGELWAGRKEPEEDLFAVYLPKTYKTLRDRLFVNNPHNLKFFACSAFGVLSRKTPLPNRIYKDGYTRAVLIDPREDKWKPYGLISPIIWLNGVTKWHKYEL